MRIAFLEKGPGQVVEKLPPEAVEAAVEWMAKLLLAVADVVDERPVSAGGPDE